MSEPTLRVVASDTVVTWDRDEVAVPKGTLISTAAGSALEAAYGADNVPEASAVELDAANGGSGSLAQSN
jgi:hypothetical protein